MGLYTEEGTWESVSWLNADDYTDAWHNFKIAVGSDRIVKFYVDNELIYTSKKKIDETVLQEKKIFLGIRSSGSAGKAYHDYVKVYAKTPSISNIIYVPDDYPTIHQAVNAANSGDTIIVRDGTYIENVDVNKPHLTIRSENGAASTVVQAKNSKQHVFEVTADYVNISGFTVKGAIGSYSGIRLKNTEYCSMSNNNVLNNGYGICLWSSSNNDITNNYVNSNVYNGIFLYSANNNNIKGNTIMKENLDTSYDNPGIWLDYSRNNIFANNNILNYKYGIYSRGSSNNMVYLNNFINNANNIRPTGSTNTWNSPSKITYIYNGNAYTSFLGNYWDDYTGSDLDRNGIGDTSYRIDLDNDFYPLKAPFESYFKPPPSQNLLKNPDFEDQLLYWSDTKDSAIYTASDQEPHGGFYCAKGVEVHKGNLGRLYQDVTGIVKAGERYKIGGWIKTEDVVGKVVIALNYVDENGWCPADGYVKEIGHVRGTTDWTYYESEWFTLPPMPEDGVAAWFLFDFNNGKGTAYWDDVSLHAEDTAEYYVENYGPLRIATTKEPAYSGDHFYTADTLQTPDNPSSGTMLKALIWPPLGKSISSPITKVRVGTYIECIDGDYNSQSLEYRLYAYNIETGEITRKIHDDTWPPTGNTPTYFPLSYGLKTYDDMIICDTKKSALDEKETLILLSICHHFGAKSHHTKYAAHFDTKDYPAYMEVFTSDGKSTKYYIHDSFTTPTVETITIDQILKDAKLIEKVQTDSPVHLHAIIDNGDFTATIQGDYAIWEKPLTTYNIVDSERYFTYPTEVTLRFAINTEGDFYVGAIGPESECLSVLAMRGWDSGIRILEKPYKGAYLDLDLKQNLLARSLWDEYSAFSEEILSEKNDLRTFYNLPFSLFSNYEKSVFVIAAPIISGDGHYNKEYYQEISDKWCPFSNYDETGEAKRTFKLRYSGEKYSFVNGYAACDNGNIAYIKTDGETLAYRNRYWVTNKYSTDVYPKSVEVGFGITWSIARPTVGIAVVADNVQIIEHSEWAKGVKNPSDSLDGNPSPVMMVLEQGWNMPTTITNAIAPTISNVKVSPTYALPGDSINISADVFDSSGIRWVRALISKGGEYIVTLFMSDPIEMHL
jgi:parallel beta-helix repeat protein